MGNNMNRILAVVDLLEGLLFLFVALAVVLMFFGLNVSSIFLLNVFSGDPAYYFTMPLSYILLSPVPFLVFIIKDSFEKANATQADKKKEIVLHALPKLIALGATILVLWLVFVPSIVLTVASKIDAKRVPVDILLILLITPPRDIYDIAIAKKGELVNKLKLEYGPSLSIAILMFVLVALKAPPVMVLLIAIWYVLTAARLLLRAYNSFHMKFEN